MQNGFGMIHSGEIDPLALLFSGHDVAGPVLQFRQYFCRRADLFCGCGLLFADDAGADGDGASLHDHPAS